MRIIGARGVCAARRRGRSLVLAEKREQNGRHFHLTRCHISAAQAARACLHPSPSRLRLSRRDTNYRFLALPAYCLTIYASFADTAMLLSYGILLVYVVRVEVTHPRPIGWRVHYTVVIICLRNMKQTYERLYIHFIFVCIICIVVYEAECLPDFVSWCSYSHLRSEMTDVAESVRARRVRRRLALAHSTVYEWS